MGAQVRFRTRFPQTIVVYSDESSQNAHRYFVVGGIFFGLRESADVEAVLQQLESHLQTVKDEYGLRGRVKWDKVPTRPGRFLDGYKAFLRGFLEDKRANFKCMIVDTSKYPLGNRKLWGGDPLVGYLKFYCVFLSDGLLSRYHHYFFDIRIDQYQFRPDCDCQLLEDTVERRFIKKKKPEPCLEYCSVKALDERQHNLLQLADLLVGTVAFVWHGGMQRTSARSRSQQELVHLVQTTRKVDLSRPTRWAEDWFNIWELKPASPTP